MYCEQCGTKLGTRFVKNEGEVPYCNTCEKLFFEKSNVAMIAIVVNKDNKICLVNQKGAPKYKVLIAGYLKVGETIEQCVEREIKEEIGLTISEITFMKSHYYDNKNVLMMGFYAKTNDIEFEIDEEEIESANWYNQDDCLWRIREGSIAYQLVTQYINLNERGEHYESINSKVSQ